MSDSAVAVLDVGGTLLKGGLIDPEGCMLPGSQQTVERAAAGDGERLVERISRLARELVDDAARRGVTPLAVGLVVPGIVDEERGVGVSSMILGWRDVPFVDRLQRELDLPVGFGHDVVSAAVAEGRLGAARDARDWLFIAIGTGLGAAFFYRGEPYRGSRGLGGELAHVVVDESGPPCRCGKRGCAEMIVSGPAIADAYRRATGVERPVSARDVAGLAGAGDAAAREVWDGAVRGLATVVANHVESADPERVVIGGGVAEAGPLLFDPLLAQLRERIRYAVPPPPVVPAAFGDRAGLQGAALLAFQAARCRRPLAAALGSGEAR